MIELTYVSECGDLKSEGTISDEDGGSNLDGSWKGFIGASDLSWVSESGIVGSELDDSIFSVSNVSTSFSVSGSNFWTFSVKHDCDWLVWSFGHSGSQSFEAIPVSFMISVRHIESSDVHTSIDHFDKHVFFPAGWSKIRKRID
jgi:hypothetical protein